MANIEHFSKWAEIDNQVMGLMTSIYAILETIISSMSNNTYNVDQVRRLVQTRINTPFDARVISCANGTTWVETQAAMMLLLPNYITGDKSILLGHVMGMINIHIEYAKEIQQKWSDVARVTAM